ncbi:divergent PAP2 family protein [Selenihalanaerobacter shriftii]|uniref:Divergent PAP2 family protein n=1 Tax=Selenihalanaerobacter shriftii TaxID=142842 RepID=A0A1T4P1V2_9FIRM|nr:divergent PAP2 family protein [Selenihalanaerobacter shriftii]SJZ85495.1 hypothetical protein SAMN02745118_02007 [Selenihalanaerobacter shriftii]
MFIKQILANQVLLTGATAWLIAQLLKVILNYSMNRRLNLERFVGSGGMPSSHAAFIMALSTRVGLKEGWNSSLYGVTLGVALIVMYDAAGVRRAAGKQAKILNEIADEIFHHGELKQQKLKELVGHTPYEVIVGALLGILIALLLYYY